MVYCVKCRKDTANEGKVIQSTTKNGRKMEKVKCAVCGTTKCKFIK